MASKPHRMLDTANARLFHYYLVAGEVMIESRDNPELQSSVKLNAILQTESQQVNTEQLAKAQQMLQALLAQKVGPDAWPTLKVTDVYIQAISHLGRMTAGEFEKAPKMPAMSQRDLEAKLPMAN